MGRRGRRHVERHYDIDRLNDRLVDLYAALLAGERLGAAERARQSAATPEFHEIHS
jgi:colanic acid/amylovoran biosynthesis glycosyltransferase